MPRCDCSGGQCGCVVIGGSGAVVRGAGSTTNPYIIDADPQLPARIRVADTDTVDLAAVGNGTEDDPLVISANATISMDGLSDVDAASPTAGDTLVWNGEEWVVQAPAVVPPGAVNVGAGLVGTGAVETPLAAAVSGVWGTEPLDGYGDDSTVGLVVYVDSNGQLRAEPRDTSDVSWDEITGKPSAFPTTWNTVTGKPSEWPVSAFGSGFLTARSGWSVMWQHARNRGGVVTMSLRIRRTGAAISVPASGNVANQQIATITNATLRPYQYGPMATSSTGPTILALSSSNGVITVTSTVPNVNIARGAEFVLTGTWVCAGS